MAALGGLLIVIGFAVAIPRGMFPGSSSHQNRGINRLRPRCGRDKINERHRHAQLALTAG
jgi:hypothetical protein